MPSLTTSPLSSAGTRIPVRTIAVEVVSGPDAGVRAEADSERLTVGTANGNVLVLTDPTVSRFHLELARDQSGIVVTDLESIQTSRADTNKGRRIFCFMCTPIAMRARPSSVQRR